MEEEMQEPLSENRSGANNPERSSYWEELLKYRYEVHKVEEFNSMGKGKRSRKQMVSVEGDDLAGLENVSSNADDNYEAELSDADDNYAGTTPTRKPHRKKTRVDNAELLPLMEGEGRAFRVLGFNQSQRAHFVQIFMRYGVGDFDWVEFTSRLKQKSYKEIKVKQQKFHSRKTGHKLNKHVPFTTNLAYSFAYRRGWYEVLQLAPLTCLTGPRATHESPLV